MKVTKREHACLIVEHDGAALVIDPGSFTSPFTVDNLAVIVITHEHGDHVTPEHLDRLLGGRDDIPLFAPAGVAAAHPDRPWDVVDGGDMRTAGPFALSFFGGRHAMIHRSIPLVDNVGVMVNETLYYPGDSFTVPDREVEVLAVPSSAPWLKVGEVMDYVDTVRPRRAFSTHERVNSEAGQAMADARIRHVTDLHGGVFTALAPGESLELD